MRLQDVVADRRFSGSSTSDALPEMFTPAAIDPDLGAPGEQAPEIKSRFDMPIIPGFVRAVEVQADFPEACGEPASLWARLLCPFHEGEETSPVVRLATLADFASGTGNAMDYSKYTSINPDLTIHILRNPVSDWLGLRGVTLRSSDGIGQSTATAYDLEGPVAQIQASLLLDRR